MKLVSILKKINHSETYQTELISRKKCLKILEGDCETAVGVSC